MPRNKIVLTEFCFNNFPWHFKSFEKFFAHEKIVYTQVNTQLKLFYTIYKNTKPL